MLKVEFTWKYIAQPNGILVALDWILIEEVE